TALFGRVIVGDGTISKTAICVSVHCSLWTCAKPDAGLAGDCSKRPICRREGQDAGEERPPAKQVARQIGDTAHGEREQAVRPKRRIEIKGNRLAVGVCSDVTHDSSAGEMVIGWVQ